MKKKTNNEEKKRRRREFCNYCCLLRGGGGGGGSDGGGGGIVQLSSVSCRSPAATWASKSLPSSGDTSGCAYDNRKWHVPGMCSGKPTGRHDRLLSSNENPGVCISSLRTHNIQGALPRRQYV